VQVAKQDLEEILTALSPLDVQWQDDKALKAIALMAEIPEKAAYERADVQALLERDFEHGLLLLRMFLGIGKDRFVADLRAQAGGPGAQAFRTDPEGFVHGLESMGVLEAMAAEINREPTWRDILIERLRFGRGSAIQGQNRGRQVEDVVAEVVARVFGTAYERNCPFTGRGGQTAKCDFAIPDREEPHILIEAKGYGATGSKQTDVLGDVLKIIEALRRDQTLLLFIDGETWRERQNDLRKLVEHQNQGDVLRIYTTETLPRLQEDLARLKDEYEIG